MLNLILFERGHLKVRIISPSINCACISTYQSVLRWTRNLLNFDLIDMKKFQGCRYIWYFNSVDAQGSFTSFDKALHSRYCLKIFKTSISLSNFINLGILKLKIFKINFERCLFVSQISRVCTPLVEASILSHNIDIPLWNAELWNLIKNDLFACVSIILITVVTKLKIFIWSPGIKQESNDLVMLTVLKFFCQLKRI